MKVGDVQSFEMQMFACSGRAANIARKSLLLVLALLLGSCHFSRQDDSVQARSEFGESKEALTRRASEFESKGQDRDALKVYTSYVSRFPGDRLGYSRMAEVLLRLKRFDLAAQVLTSLEYESIGPTSSMQRLRQAEALMAAGRSNEALTYVDAGLLPEVRGDASDVTVAQLHLRRSACLLSAGSYTEAIAAADMSIAVAEQSDLAHGIAAALLIKGLAYHGQGRGSKATECILTSLHQGGRLWNSIRRYGFDCSMAVELRY